MTNDGMYSNFYRYTAYSVLVTLIKVGYFKAAEYLVRCGYNFKEDVEFKNLDFSKLHTPMINVLGRRYRRVDYEDAKSEFRDMLKNCEEDTLSLAYICRRTLQQHFVTVYGGCEIETESISRNLRNLNYIMTDDSSDTDESSDDDDYMYFMSGYNGYHDSSD
jgi:hypothetical protein